MKRYIFYNNNFVDTTQALFTMNTRLRYGDGVFDTMLSVNGMPMHVTLHHTRLLRAAKILDIPVNIDIAVYKSNVRGVLNKNDHAQGKAVVNTYIIRRDSTRGLLPENASAPHVVITSAPLAQKSAPITAMISDIRRNEGSPLSCIKSMNYGDNILARIEADNAGATEALMLNNAGNAACFTVGNVYIRRGDILYTPPLSDGAMNGIIRGILMERGLAREQSITQTDLTHNDGVYLSNSIRGITNVQTLNGRDVISTPLPFENDLHLKR